MFYTSQDSAALERKLGLFLEAHSNAVGARVLQILKSSPGRRFDVMELCMHLIAGPLPYGKTLDLIYSAWGDVPACDAKALRDYRRRLARLEGLLASGEADGDSSRRAEWEREAAFLRAEIRNSTKPNGQIKGIHPEKKRAYTRVHNALERLLAKADEPLRAYVRLNLRSGMDFIWLGLPPAPEQREAEPPLAA